MKYDLINIKNEKGLELILSPVGAGIYAIVLDGKYMTLTPSNIDDFNKGYYGKTVGPVPNRLDKGIININNKVYIIDINEGLNSLHSGNKGICYKNFEYQIKEEDNWVKVIFNISTFPTIGTVPGNLEYKIVYILDKYENNLKILFESHSDELTYISLTNHAYFNLGETNLEKISLKLPSKSFIETRETDLIPLREREMLPCLDFNKQKRILKDIDDPYLKNHRSFGIDHCYKLDSNKLSLESLKYKLEIETDFKYVQIYTDNYEDGVKMIGAEDKHYRGVAIEPQDSILSRELTEKNTPYQRYILYKFSKK